MPAWTGPPPHVLGGATALSGQVLRTDNAFVGLGCVSAYRTGVALSVVVFAWRGDLDDQHWQALEASVSGFDHGFGAPSPSARGPRWSVELVDGSQVALSATGWDAALSATGWDVPDAIPQPPGLIQIDNTSSSSESEVDRQVDLWLWPLPEGEAISLVLQWAEVGISAAAYRIDLDVVRAAAERAVPFHP